MPTITTDSSATPTGPAGLTGSVTPVRDGPDATVGLAELVCADRDWLRREFAELIAANYPTEAAATARLGPPRRTGVVTRPGRRPWRPPIAGAPPSGRAPGVTGRRRRRAVEPGRQRSPPGTSGRRSGQRAAGDTGPAIVVTRPTGRR